MLDCRRVALALALLCAGLVCGAPRGERVDRRNPARPLQLRRRGPGLRRWIAQPDVDVALGPEWNVGGHGVPGRTEGRVKRREVTAVIRTNGFSLFYRRDTPLMQPRAVLGLEPQPDFLPDQ